eukprot:scaffold10098_cov96-Cylindrotheca_fusiformis.AAC.3
MDATAQLKGILGIPGGGTATATIEASGASATPPKANQGGNQNAAKSKKNKNKNKKKQQQQQQKQKNIATQNGNKQKKNKKGQGTQQASPNFAWSAFQSSPDASKLPIPAFSPNEAKPIKIIPAPASYATAASGTSDAALENSVNQPSPTPPGAPTPPDISSQNVAIDSNLPPVLTETPVKESATGVNLMAVLKPPTPSQSPLPPPPPQHTYPPSPLHHHQTPPGYMQIQVQVPPYLPPNRQMLVQTMPGYPPVQVTVPQGIPPGAIIPVHVPAMPMHMMPPPPQQHGAHHLPPRR